METLTKEETIKELYRAFDILYKINYIHLCENVQRDIAELKKSPGIIF